jgi:hypothetical protein
MRKVSSKLLPFWTQPKRNDIALWAAGYLCKNGVPKNLACDLMEHIIEIAGLPDDSLRKTLRRVEDTYAKDLQGAPLGGYTRLLEAVDGDASVIRTINQEFEKLGYHFSGNGKARKQDQKQQEKIQIPIFKYTARFKQPIHEAILLGNEAFFLTWNQQKQVIECIYHIEENKRILRPPDEGEYPYEPIEFESLEEIREYAELARHETIDSLYQKVKSTVTLYVDQEVDIIILISSDIIWTYFQDLFPTTHYYDVNGKANGIGKSTIGHVFEGIAYRAVRMTDPSAANLFRVLGQIEPGQCILIADEADRMHQDKDALSILKEGYGRFGKVSKINTNSLKQEFYYCYGFKIRIAEESLRANITKGVIDRSFQIKAIRGKPTHDIKEVLNPASRIERLEKLHRDLKRLRKLLLIYRLIHFNDSIPDINVGLDGRDKELCKPLLQLFYRSKAYNEVRNTVLAFLESKNKRKKSTAIEPVLFEIVVSMIESKQELTLLFNDIWEKIRSEVSGVYDERKPNEYQTYDYDTIYRNTVSKTIEGFGAEHDRTYRGRVLNFKPKLLSKTAKQYDVSKEVDEKLEYLCRHGVMVSWSKKHENITQYKDRNKDTPEESSENGDKRRHDTMTSMTSIVSDSDNENGIYSCPYFDCDNRFATSDLYLRHVIKKHPDWTAYPDPQDLEKYRQVQHVKDKDSSKAANVKY